MLSALRRWKFIPSPPGDAESMLLRRKCPTGESGCPTADCGSCGRLWLCECVYGMVPCAMLPVAEVGDVLVAASEPTPGCDSVGPCCPARWKTGTLARCAISISPICQCMASAALQGSCISLEIFSHMSFLNLFAKSITLSHTRFQARKELTSRTSVRACSSSPRPTLIDAPGSFEIANDN